MQEQHGREGPGAVRGEQGAADPSVAGEGERDQLPRVSVAVLAGGELGGVRGVVLPVDEEVRLHGGAGGAPPGVEVPDR